MEWKKLVKREHKDLEKIMKRELNLFRNKDIDFYNILESNYEDLKLSLSENDSLSKELIKIIKTMKKAKIDDLDEYVEDTDESFRSMIRLESNAIANSRDNYLSNRESLISLFSQVDKNLVFIKQGVIQYQSVLPDLKFKKIKIEQSLDRYMNILNEVLLLEQQIAIIKCLNENNNPWGAWETAREAQGKFNDDNELLKISVELSEKVSSFVRVIKRAEKLENEKHNGMSLTWYLKAKSIYPKSTYAKSGMNRLLNTILPADVENISEENSSEEKPLKLNF